MIRAPDPYNGATKTRRTEGGACLSRKKPEDSYGPVPLDQLIISGSNVRRSDIRADVDELAKNMAQHGLLQPIVVQEMGDKFEVLIGQRRYLAARELGWDAIPARIVAPPLDEMEIKVASFSENALRRDLEARDKAEVCQYLYDRLGSVSAVADHLGVSPPTVSKWLGYAAVPDSLKDLVSKGSITRPQAERLWAGVADEEKAVEIGRLIGEKNTTPQEQKLIITAAEELPDRSIPTIMRRSVALKDRHEIHFVLPEKWARTMANASKELGKDADDIALDATIDWLEQRDLQTGRL